VLDDKGISHFDALAKKPGLFENIARHPQAPVFFPQPVSCRMVQ